MAIFVHHADITRGTAHEEVRRDIEQAAAFRIGNQVSVCPINFNRYRFELSSTEGSQRLHRGTTR
jgi:hypothetical protein